MTMHSKRMVLKPWLRLNTRVCRVVMVSTLAFACLVILLNPIASIFSFLTATSDAYRNAYSPSVSMRSHFFNVEKTEFVPRSQSRLGLSSKTNMTMPSSLAIASRIFMAAHLNESLETNPALPLHVQALLRSLLPMTMDVQNKHDRHWTLQLQHPEHSEQHETVEFSIILTCIDFGHACHPTCPLPSVKLQLHPAITLIPIACPGDGNIKQFAEYGDDANEVAAWNGAMEHLLHLAGGRAHEIAKMALLLLNHRVLDFENQYWLWELLHRARTTLNVFIVSGVLAYGSPTPSHPTTHLPNSKRQPSSKQGWQHNAGFVFRMAGLFEDANLNIQDAWEGERRTYKPVPVHYRQGFEAGMPLNDAEVVLGGVGGDVALVSLDAVQAAGGKFHAGYCDSALAVVDLCLWLRGNGAGGGRAPCVLQGSSIALADYFDYDDLYVAGKSTRRVKPAFERHDTDLIYERHADVIMQIILQNLWLNERIILLYDTVWGKGCSGCEFLISSRLRSATCKRSINYQGPQKSCPT
ncbi:hypothetical protein BC830DRAFT_544470 [Chytriomyces sp. MP71]|nr:hypothetical protein BC830DRAFT_544470 [Chytriomyces sp. MP71]